MLRGFVINKEELEVMNRLDRENSKFIGFRVYMGINELGGKVGVIYGIDSNGQDATTSSIYSTDFSSSGPCPPVCD